MNANETRRRKRLFLRHERAEPGQPLDHREITVLHWCSRGETRDMIAKRLGISQSYVNFFCECMFRKLGARTMPHAVAEGFRRGYLDLSNSQAGRRKRK